MIGEIPSEMKIWRMNDYEWWIGIEFLETANAAAMNSGEKLEDFIDDPREITRDKWRKIKISVEDDFSKMRTINWHVKNMIKNGHKFPACFCVSDP